MWTADFGGCAAQSTSAVQCPPKSVHLISDFPILLDGAQRRNKAVQPSRVPPRTGGDTFFLYPSLSLSLPFQILFLSSLAPPHCGEKYIPGRAFTSDAVQKGMAKRSKNCGVKLLVEEKSATDILTFGRGRYG